jgi:hypothetical protein
MIDYRRISITIELPDTARHDMTAAQMLLKVIAWLQDEHVHTGRVAMELLPPSRY